MSASESTAAGPDLTTTSAAFQALHNDVIRDHLFSLLSKSDLAICCLLSKTLFEPAVRHLYREINFEHLYDIYFNNYWTSPWRCRGGSNSSTRQKVSERDGSDGPRDRSKLYRQSVKSLVFAIEYPGLFRLGRALVNAGGEEEIFSALEHAEDFLGGALPALSRYVQIGGTDYEDMGVRVFNVEEDHDKHKELAIIMDGDILWKREHVQKLVDITTSGVGVNKDRFKSVCKDVEVVETPYCRDGGLLAAMYDIRLLTGRDIATVRIGNVNLRNLDPRTEGGEIVRFWPAHMETPPTYREWGSDPTRQLIDPIGFKITRIQMHFFATAEDIVAIGLSCPNLQHLSQAYVTDPDFRDRESMTTYGPRRCLDVFVLLAIAAPHMRYLKTITWSCWPASAQWQTEQAKQEIGLELVLSHADSNNIYPYLVNIEGRLPYYIKGSLACLETYNKLIRSVVSAPHTVELIPPPSSPGSPPSWRESHIEDQRAAFGPHWEPCDQEGRVHRSSPGESQEPVGLYGTASQVVSETLAYEPADRHPVKAWNAWVGAHTAFWEAWIERLRGLAGDLMVQSQSETQSQSDSSV